MDILSKIGPAKLDYSPKRGLLCEYLRIFCGYELVFIFSYTFSTFSFINGNFDYISYHS